jgi:hypothetical protein
VSGMVPEASGYATRWLMWCRFSVDLCGEDIMIYFAAVLLGAVIVRAGRSIQLRRRSCRRLDMLTGRLPAA